MDPLECGFIKAGAQFSAASLKYRGPLIAGSLKQRPLRYCAVLFFSETPGSTGLQGRHDYNFIELKYLSRGPWSFVLQCQGFRDTEIVIMQTKIIIMGPRIVRFRCRGLRGIHDFIEHIQIFYVGP